MEPLDGIFLPLDGETVARLLARVKSDGFPANPNGVSSWIRKRLETIETPRGGRNVPPLLLQGAAWAQRNPDKIRVGLEIASKLLRRTP